MTKEIPLTQGLCALVDDDDFEWLSELKWYAFRSSSARGTYAVNHKRSLFNSPNVTFMHRLVMRAPAGLFVDHINHNTLDNTKSNLRLCIHSQNSSYQQLSLRNKSGYKGVTWRKAGRDWEANIRVERVKIRLGLFNTPLEAAIAYDEAAINYFGEYALTNKQMGLLPSNY